MAWSDHLTRSDVCLYCRACRAVVDSVHVPAYRWRRVPRCEHGRDAYIQWSWEEFQRNVDTSIVTRKKKPTATTHPFHYEANRRKIRAPPTETVVAAAAAVVVT
jgi:hypothetical protein